ncbi:MAG: tetratricopeptide repeat protein [Cyanobium sp.]
MRYLPLLRHQGMAVALCADPKLHGLIQASGIDPAPLTASEALKRRQGVWLPLLSLPQHLGVSAREPRVVEPYIRTTPEALARWQALLDREPGPLIALNWQGNPDHETTTSRGRSLPLELLAPLAQIGGARFVSLQKGPGSEQLERCSFRHRFVACQPQVNGAWDFLDTAAILACCDLVISSDTALAHLAGGLGRPTWLLLKDVPEWRWGLQGDRSGWYPSMRLFRQQRRGDWQELMQRLMLALQLHFGWATQPAPAHGGATTVGRPLEAPAITVPSLTRLQQAEALFAAARWVEAEALYRDLIHTDPADAQLFHRLGQICGLNGRFQEMAEWLEKGLQLRPEDPAALGNLGLAYQELGHLEAALDAYGRSLHLRPDAPDVRTNQGTAWQARGDLQAAIACYRQALMFRPQHAEAHCNLGLALREQGDNSAALEAYQQAIHCQPDLARAHYNMGCLHYAEQRYQEAIRAYQQVIRIQPQFADAHTSLGNAYKQAGDLEAAIAAYQQALAHRPEDADTLCNLGNSYLVRSELPAAIACFQHALAIDPTHALTLHNLGLALQEQGDVSAAITAFRRSLHSDPSFAEAHGALAMALLLAGAYPQGWQEYEWRFQCQHGPHLLAARPDLSRWAGQPLAAGCALILVSEQGLGDTLQFLRYGLHLQHQGLEVHLCAPSKLHGLIQLSGLQTLPLTPEQATQLTADSWPGAHWLPLLSLPGLLEVTPETPLLCDPYLRSSEERIEAWREHLAVEQRPIVAIHWQGNPDHEQTTSMGRSLPLEAFAPLAQIEGLSLLSLQKGHGSEQLERCSFRDRFVACQELVNATWDFVDTAAIVAHCDLVITSDTALAHLAAGMGQPTWLLLKHPPEWRWGLQGERSFWYPSMRLFRQRSRGDWAGVMERVVATIMIES